MPSYNDYLHESSRLLYDYSSNFRISIDLVQKLAQHLGLDTFVDSEVQDPDTHQSVKRLSIAGSLLLVDIDFSDPHTVTKVSLASGNHSSTAINTTSSRSEERSVISTTKIDNTTVVRVNFSEDSVLSFLNVRDSEGVSVAETILKENLSGPRLGNFPANLRYLANLDRLSPAEGDLVLYLDNIANYLEVIHMQECKLRPDDVDIQSGQSGLVGKLMYNNIETSELGVFLHFWTTFNKTKSLPQHKIFDSRTYVGQIAVVESDQPAKDYLKEATKALWEPIGSDGAHLEYKFTFDDDKHLPKGVPVAVPNARNWQLQFRLNHPVFLPQEILDILGVDSYVKSTDEAAKEIFEKIKNDGTLNFVIDGSPSVTVQLDLTGYSNFVGIKAFTLPSLSTVFKIIPSLRNFITFSNWIHNLSKDPQCNAYDSTELEAKKSRDGRSGLTGDEILGLNTMAENNAYVGVQILDSNTNTDLEDFMKQEDEDENMDKDNEESKAVTPESEEPSIVLTLDDIDFASRHIDLRFMATGKSKSGTTIETSFTLQNGSMLKSDEGSLASKRFVKALDITEDLMIALDVVN